jgi:hypothetical protein
MPKQGDVHVVYAKAAKAWKSTRDLHEYVPEPNC